MNTNSATRVATPIANNASDARDGDYTLYGLAILFALYGLVLLGLIAIVVAAWPTLLPDWMSTDAAGKRVAIGAVGVFTVDGVYRSLRTKALAGGRGVQQLMQYVESEQVRRKVGNELTRSIDRIVQIPEMRMWQSMSWATALAASSL